MRVQHLRWCAIVLVCGMAFPPGVPCLAGAAPSTQQTIRGDVLDDQNAGISEALCTLAGRTLPTAGLTATTDYKGHFEFAGLQPGEYSLLCAAAGRQPLKRTLEIADNAPPDLQLILPRDTLLRQSVEVREQTSTLSTDQNASSTKMTNAQLSSLPLAEQKFKAALPYLPGVVRTPDGRLNIKGVPDTQGQLLVNSAETEDPVTGNPSIDVPIVAIDSLQVFKNTYDAQYGGFTGGLTTIHTRPPSDQWKFETQYLLPNPNIKKGSIRGIADFNPRLYVSGPLLANRLTFSESFGYDIDKQPVRGLSWPNNQIWTHDVSSFTDFHYVFSPHHLASLTANVFPLRRQFANINSLIPVGASSDYGQHGFKITFSDQYITSGGAVLTTLLDGMQFYSWGHGEGPANMLVTPNGWAGNFFNAFQRDSEQEQFTEMYKLPRKAKHEWTMGLGALNRNYNGHSHSRPVEILRPDGTVAQEISFMGGDFLGARDTEATLFASDHWVPSDRISFDLGLRISGQTLSSPITLAPRLGFAFSPGHDERTVFRGGVGRFVGHIPLLADNFPLNPSRHVSTFDTDGNLLFPPVTYVNAYGSLTPQGTLTPAPGFPSAVPYNWTWSLELDREINSRLMLRVNYLSSHEQDEFIIDPVSNLPTGSAMLLTSHGAAHYNELETTLHIRLASITDWNVSYVYSRARGDLNTLAQLFVPFEEPVIRPDAYSNLNSDIPHRVVGWGRFKTHFWGIEAGPVVDYHSGFPFTPIDTMQNYIGIPNTSRFPHFFSLDMKLAKDIHLPLPIIKKHLMRGSLTVFNLSNHKNPRDVFNNISSPAFRQFTGNQHRFFDTSLDIVY